MTIARQLGEGRMDRGQWERVTDTLRVCMVGGAGRSVRDARDDSAVGVGEDANMGRT